MVGNQDPGERPNRTYLYLFGGGGRAEATENFGAGGQRVPTHPEGGLLQFTEWNHRREEKGVPQDEGGKGGGAQGQEKTATKKPRGRRKEKRALFLSTVTQPL